MFPLEGFEECLSLNAVIILEYLLDPMPIVFCKWVRAGSPVMDGQDSP
jgi:hypothetical protein